MIAPNPKIAATVKRYYLSNVKKRGPKNPTRGANWAQVDKALHGKASDYILPGDRMLKPMTAADATSRVKNWHGWRPIANELRRLERERRLHSQGLVDIGEPITDEDAQALQAQDKKPVRPAGVTAEEATRADTSNPYRIERIATGYQVFCNSTPMQKYETWPEANAEYERLSADLREQRMRVRSTDRPAPRFPWAACPWEKTLDDHGLSDDVIGAALERIGPNTSLFAREARQAVAQKVWERANPPIWAGKDAAAYAAQNEALVHVLGGSKSVPQGWIDGCFASLDAWREAQNMGMGGVKSMYVSKTKDGEKKHFATKEERDAWEREHYGGFPLTEDKKGWVTDPRNGVRVRTWRGHPVEDLKYRLITSNPNGMRQVTYFAYFKHVGDSMGCLKLLPDNKETEDRWIAPEDLPKVLEEGGA